MTQKRNLPLAEVELRYSKLDSIFYWRVLVCPFCGGTHLHGGAKRGEEDPRDNLTPRVGHCLGDEFRGRQYLLHDPDPARTVATARAAGVELPPLESAA